MLPAALPTPDDEDRTVADARGPSPDRAVTVERAAVDDEATRIEGAPKRIEDAAAATEIAPESSMPVLKQLRAKERQRAAISERETDPRERLAPPVPPSLPSSPLPVPSAPTDPVGVAAIHAAMHPSAPTTPTRLPTDEEATRLAPKADKKKALRPGPPLISRPVARRALAKIKSLTMEISAVSVSSASAARRRVSRLILATLVLFSVVVLIQLYKAFTVNNAEVARPFNKRQEEPSFWDKFFRFQDQAK